MQLIVICFRYLNIDNKAFSNPDNDINVIHHIHNSFFFGLLLCGWENIRTYLIKVFNKFGNPSKDWQYKRNAAKVKKKMTRIKKD